MDSDNKEEIRKLFEKWQSVQAYLKRAELITQAAPIAAINELRYAGRVFSHAVLMARDLDNTFGFEKEIHENSQTLPEAIIITNQYLRNANHDISDALVYYYSSVISSISDSFSRSVEGIDHGKIEQARSIILECKELIVESRSDLSKRSSNYEKLKENMLLMEELYPEIEKAPYKVAGKLKYRNTFRLTKKLEILYLAVAAAIGAIFSFLFFR